MVKKLSNEPLGADRMNGGAQFRLAQRIAEEIRNPSRFYDGSGGEVCRSVVLAIEGRWGIGKTNVLRMAEDEVGQITGDGQGRKRVVFVNYDLWAHRQELTRKSILETIVAKLTEGGYSCLPRSFRADLYALTGATEIGHEWTMERWNWMPAVAVAFFAALLIWRKGFDNLPGYAASIVVLALLGSFVWDWRGTCGDKNGKIHGKGKDNGQ